ncbi:hypothetical protein D9M70_631170 [compost metagenome]
MEGLFPKEWIIQAHNDHPGWFKNFSCDLDGNLLPFECASDGAKEKLREYLKRKVEDINDDSWIGRFEKLFDVIDEALEFQARKLYGAHANARSEQIIASV